MIHLTRIKRVLFITFLDYKPVNMLVNKGREPKGTNLKRFKYERNKNLKPLDSRRLAQSLDELFPGQPTQGWRKIGFEVHHGGLDCIFLCPLILFVLCCSAVL